MTATFNAKVRAECLDQHWFESLEEAKKQLETWRQEYNQERPHSSLGDLAPAEFAAAWQQQEPRQAAA
jgi:putative transposase